MRTNLGIVDPTIDARIDQALRTADQGAREGMWADIDHKVMEDAFVLPGVWPKGLIYRPPNLTNAFVSAGFSDVRLHRAGNHQTVTVETTTSKGVPRDSAVPGDGQVDSNEVAEAVRRAAAGDESAWNTIVDEFSDVYGQ